MITAPRVFGPTHPPYVAAPWVDVPRDPIVPAEHLQAARWDGGCEDSQSRKGMVVAQRVWPYNDRHSVQHDIIA